MDFELSEEQQALRRTARKFLEDQGGLTRARKVVDGDMVWDRELWNAVSELGWAGAALPDKYGGGGFGPIEVAIVAEELGRVIAPVPSLAGVFAAAETIHRHGSKEQRERLLPKLATGEVVATFAVGRGSAFSETATGLSGAHPTVPNGTAAEGAIVTAESDGAQRLFWLDLRQESVDQEPTPSLDPTRPYGIVRARSAHAERLDAGLDDIQSLRDGAAVILAFEQLGTANHAFEMTKAYTESRYAFGRPVGSFQALKHRMVDLYVDLELARANCLYAAWALDVGSPELPTAAAAARVSASEVAQLAGTEMIQMHGGIGYTWEFDCHLFYRRSKVDALALGSAREWRERLVQSLEQRAPIAQEGAGQ